MTSPTDYYVDPNAGDDGSGDGSLGNPWATVQHAFDTITRDTTNGDRVNLRDSASDVISAELTLATYGTPSRTAPLVLQGYTDAQGDGGLGVIDGDGSDCWGANLASYVIHADIHYTNGGVLVNDQRPHQTFVRCTFSDTPGHAVSIGYGSVFLACDFYDVAAGFAISGSGSSSTGPFFVIDCLFDNVYGAIGAYRTPWTAVGNLVIMHPSSGTTDKAFYPNQLNTGWPCILLNNTVVGNASQAEGFEPRTLEATRLFLLNNIFAGFSGTGGKGASLTGSTQNLSVLGYNRFYNNATHYDYSAGDVLVDLGGEETLTENPFVNEAAGDFSLVDGLDIPGFPLLFDSSGVTTTRNKQAGAAGAAVVSPFVRLRASRRNRDVGRLQ